MVQQHRRPGASARTSTRRAAAGWPGWLGVPPEAQRRRVGGVDQRVQRPRLTGLLTWYSAAPGRSNWRSRKPDSPADRVLTTSRIACPKWRVVSPNAAPGAGSDLLLVDREFGVAGQAELRERLDAPAPEQPRGGRGSRWSAARRPACRRRSCPAGASPAGPRGTLTIATWFLAPGPPCPPRRDDEVPATCWRPAGNGCAGPAPPASSGPPDSKNATQRRAPDRRSAWLTTTMPARAERGHHLVVEHAYWSPISACASAATEARSLPRTPSRARRAA